MLYFTFLTRFGCVNAYIGIFMRAFTHFFYTLQTEKQLTIDDLTRKLQDLIEERERERNRLLQSPPAAVGEIERFVARFRIVQFRTHFKAETNLHGTSILDVLPCMFRSTESAEVGDSGCNNRFAYIYIYIYI